MFEKLIGFRVPEKTGDADHQVLEEGIDFERIFLHVSGVVRQLVDLMNSQAAFDPAPDGGLLVLREIVTGSAAGSGQKLFGAGVEWWYQRR